MTDTVSSGYSATPQARKLGLRAGMRLSLVSAPTDWRLTDPPDVVEAADGSVDVKVAAIDDDWSGSKIAWRKENRTR